MIQRQVWRDACPSKAIALFFLVATILLQAMAPLSSWVPKASGGPRISQISSFAQNPDQYDGFVVGLSHPSTLDVQGLEDYFGGKFYNMVAVNPTMADNVATVSHILKEYGAKRIVLVVNPPLTQGPKTGNLQEGMDTVVNLTFADYKAIGTLADYNRENPQFSQPVSGEITAQSQKSVLDGVAEIASMCAKKRTKLVVVTAPVGQQMVHHLGAQTLGSFYEALADVTEFWDFSCSPISQETRYFYDSTHHRPNVGEMMAARISGDDTVYVPENFGVYVTKDTPATYFGQGYTPLDLEQKVPILMYHHFADTENNKSVMAISNFEAHMQALRDNGYHTVSLSQLQAFVEQGTPLPEKPVVITMDDGYSSNYELAYPILQKYDMKAAIFLIGSSVGKSTYKDTNRPIIPHFTYEEGAEMVKSGLITLGSHTYDMHQSADYETGMHRPNVDKWAGETQRDYLAALQADFAKSVQEMNDNLPSKVTALAYPLGVNTKEATLAATGQGISMTFTTVPQVATLVKGQPQSLYDMPRLGVSNQLSVEALLAWVENK